MTAPEKIWAWCFQSEKHGAWKNWGGYARPTNLHPMDAREAETGAEYTRSDLLPNAAYVEALLAIADLVDIPGFAFAKKHPKLNAELDAAGSDRWGDVIAEFASSALSARPDAPDVRAVTVAQLERWIAYAEDGLVSTPIKEMRAIVGEPKK